MWTGLTSFPKAAAGTALVLFWGTWLGLFLRRLSYTQAIPELKCNPHSPLPVSGSSWIPPSWIGLAVEREVCSEARQAHAEPGTGWVWGKTGWVGTGPNLPSMRLQPGRPAFLTSPKNPADSTPYLAAPTSPKGDRGGGRGGKGKDKGREGWRFWKKLGGRPPWCGKLHVLRGS